MGGFSYASNNPVTSSDPNGLRTCSDPKDCIGDETHGNPGYGQGSTPGSSSPPPKDPINDIGSRNVGFTPKEMDYIRNFPGDPYRGPEDMSIFDALDWASSNADAWLWVCNRLGGSEQECAHSPFTGENLDDMHGKDMLLIAGLTVAGSVAIGCAAAPELCLSVAIGAGGSVLEGTAGFVMYGGPMAGGTAGTVGLLNILFGKSWGGLSGRLAGGAESGASDWPELSGVLRDAAKGKGNFGIGFGTQEQAEAAGRAWVGDNATLAGDGKTWVSQDKLRQFRPPSFKPRLDKWQANFEWRVVPDGRWQSNGHLDITDLP